MLPMIHWVYFLSFSGQKGLSTACIIDTWIQTSVHIHSHSCEPELVNHLIHWFTFQDQAKSVCTHRRKSWQLIWVIIRINTDIFFYVCACWCLWLLVTVSSIRVVVFMFKQGKYFIFNNKFHHELIGCRLFLMLETPHVYSTAEDFSSLSSSPVFWEMVETEKAWLLSSVTAHLSLFNHESSFEMPCLHSRLLG